MSAADKILPIIHPITGIHIYYVTEDELRQIELEMWTNRFFVTILLAAIATLIETVLSMLALPPLPAAGARVETLVHPLTARMVAGGFIGASIIGIGISVACLVRSRYHSTIAAVRARGVGAAGEPGKEITPAVLAQLKSEEAPSGPSQPGAKQ